MLAIQEPHIKISTTIFCELSVQGSSALCCETNCGWTCQTPFWILVYACTVALNCQITSQNACYGCEKCKKWICRMKVSKSQSHATWGRIYFLTCQNFGLLKASNEIEEWTDMTSFPPKSGRYIVHFEFETAHQSELSGGVSFASQRPLSCHWSAAITQSVGVFWSSAFFDTQFFFHDSFLIQQRPGKATTSPSH